ncbi:MAG: ABC transporter ATP-binding protein [Thermoanaerobaculia bacterium]
MQIETRQLSRSFGTVRALQDVTLSIPSGRRVGLVGPNGSGKSTLIRIFMGLLRYQGAVSIDNLDPHTQRPELARELAYVPQAPPSFAATVDEIIAAVGALRQLELGDLEAHAEALGLDRTAIGSTPFRNLSGGMKQKLLIALAFSSRAHLLILDEPTASLDAETRERFFRLFAELPSTATLVLCSHRLDEMRHLVDHVVCLEDGHIRFDGPAATYLRARALSVVEAQTRDLYEDAWLHDLGFHPGLGRWWRKTVDEREKLALLPQLASRLGGELENLHVRDLETVSLTGPEPEA